MLSESVLTDVRAVPRGGSRYLALTHALSDVVADERLAGDFEQHVLLVPNELVPAWRQTAPRQLILPLSKYASVDRSIVFDVSPNATAVLRWLRQQRSPGSALSFFTEYYPSVCAGTFAPGQMATARGPGLIMFQTPRTGSHHMKGMIANVGDFGVANAWIRPPLLEAVRLGVVSLVDHLDRCARHQLAARPRWAASIVLPFLEAAWESISADERQRFVEFVGSAHPFLLTRRDRVAQTWSLLRAGHSGRYHINSADQANDGVADALRPPEKYWLWTLFNHHYFARLETFAQSIVEQSGGTLPVVAYEELLEQPLSEAVHERVLGPMYDRNTHKLDPLTSGYARQSGVEDVRMIARLRRVIDDVDVLNPVSAQDRGTETTVCRIPFACIAEPSTVCLELQVLAGGSQIKVELGSEPDETQAAKLNEPGTYICLAAGDEVARRGSCYRISVGGAATDEAARVSLTRIFSVPVDLDIDPEFPWARSRERIGPFVIYQL